MWKVRLFIIHAPSHLQTGLEYVWNEEPGFQHNHPNPRAVNQYRCVNSSLFTSLLFLFLFIFSLFSLSHFIAVCLTDTARFIDSLLHLRCITWCRFDLYIIIAVSKQCKSVQIPTQSLSFLQSLEKLLWKQMQRHWNTRTEEVFVDFWNCTHFPVYSQDASTVTIASSNTRSVLWWTKELVQSLFLLAEQRGMHSYLHFSHTCRFEMNWRQSGFRKVLFNFQDKFHLQCSRTRTSKGCDRSVWIG